MRIFGVIGVIIGIIVAYSTIRNPLSAARFTFFAAILLEAASIISSLLQEDIPWHWTPPGQRIY